MDLQLPITWSKRLAQGDRQYPIAHHSTQINELLSEVIEESSRNEKDEKA